MTHFQPLEVTLLSYTSMSTPRDPGVTFIKTTTQQLTLYPNEANKIGFGLWLPRHPVSGTLYMSPSPIDHGIVVHMDNRHFEVPVYPKSMPRWIASFEMEGNVTIFIPIDADAPQPLKLHRMETRMISKEEKEARSQKIRARHHTIQVGNPSHKPPPNRTRDLVSLAA